VVCKGPFLNTIDFDHQHMQHHDAHCSISYHSQSPTVKERIPALTTRVCCIHAPRTSLDANVLMRLQEYTNMDITSYRLLRFATLRKGLDELDDTFAGHTQNTFCGFHVPKSYAQIKGKTLSIYSRQIVTRRLPLFLKDGSQINRTTK
jgi:hypothetical protein